MKYSVLSSGSKGNCILFTNKEKSNSFLIDAGISYKQIKLRLEMLEIDINSIKNIFITHEHSDHIKGLKVLLKNINPTIHITKNTNNYLFKFKNIDIKNIEIIKNGTIFENEFYSIKCFSKSHDAADPVAYIVKKNNYYIGVATDFGYVCENIKYLLKKSDELIIESNYDKEMLIDGNYEFFLKNRILNNKGHVSNNTISDAIITYAKKKLKRIIFSHISKNNNTHEKVLNTYNKYKSKRTDINPEIHISTEDIPTKLFNF